MVQRRHNKQVVFAEETDYRYYLKTLEAFKDLYGVKVYGFCLMTNHTHLLLVPEDTIAGLGLTGGPLSAESVSNEERAAQNFAEM